MGDFVELSNETYYAFRISFFCMFLMPFGALLKIAFGSQKNVGTRNIVRMADTIKPPTEAIPIGWVMAATLPPRANASGS